MSSRVFGKLASGEEVLLHRIANSEGTAVAHISEFGATLVSLEVVGRDGLLDHVVLGYETLEAYLPPSGPGSRWHFGNTVGRNANRIASTGFDIDDKHYDLELNNAPAGQPCHLHGGSTGFGKQLWKTSSLEADKVVFEFTSPDGHQNYPGAVRMLVSYSLETSSNDSGKVALIVSYKGSTTATTVLNPTNHAYWNLAGHRRTAAGAGDDKVLPTVTGHKLWLPATSNFTPTTAGLITTGKLLAVRGSCFDFATEPRKLQDALETDMTGGDEYATQRSFGGGIDHNFCIDGSGLRHAARLVDDEFSGLVMDILTTAPGIQVYTGNFLERLSSRGTCDVAYDYRTAICLETQCYPNAVNHPDWRKQVIVNPGEIFESTTIHQFSVSSNE